MQLTTHQIRLAEEIARKLDDRGAILWHRKMVAEIPEEVLREKLALTLAQKGLHSKGAYYNSRIKEYVFSLQDSGH